MTNVIFLVGWLVLAVVAALWFGLIAYVGRKGRR